MRRTVLHDPPVGRPQLLDLRLAPDEGATQTTHSTRTHQRKRAQKSSAGHAVRLPLRLDRLWLPELKGATRRRHRALADQDLAGRRGLLEACTHVDGVAGRPRAALTRPADDHLACVDADPEREQIAEHLAEPTLHRKRRVQRPLGVVLVRRGSAKAGHHRIAGELLHSPAGPIDLHRHRLVKADEESARTLWVRRAGELRRAHKVSEQNRRHLALFLRRRGIHRRGTGVTEPGAVRVLLTALCKIVTCSSVRPSDGWGFVPTAPARMR